MSDGIEGTSDVKADVLHERVAHATEAELQRLRTHLCIADDADAVAIEHAYLRSADNSILAAVNGIVPREAPTYSRVLHLIYRKLRPYTEGLDETWHRVKAVVNRRDSGSPTEQLADEELERRILELYAAEYWDQSEKRDRQETLTGRALKPIREILADKAKWVPAGGAALVSSAVTALPHTATRLPFAAAAPAAAGPIGIALTVVLVGAQLAGPAYRKITLATVELLLIGQRIQHMPDR